MDCPQDVRWKFEPFLSKGQCDIGSVDKNSSLTLEVIEHTQEFHSSGGSTLSGLKSKSEELKAEFRIPF